MGVFEKPPFDKGTLGAGALVAASRAVTVVGGGESVQAAHEAGVAEKFTHVSTGGGASLEFLAEGKLPGIEALNDADIERHPHEALRRQLEDAQDARRGARLRRASSPERIGERPRRRASSSSLRPSPRSSEARDAARPLVPRPARTWPPRPTGAYTGEVSAAMAGRRGLPLRHRRPLRAAAVFGEDGPTLAKKLARCRDAGLTPIYCVGETAEERDAGRTAATLARQVETLSRGSRRTRRSSSPTSRSGRSGPAAPPTPADAEAARAHLAQLSRRGRPGLRILYGGSVTPENAGRAPGGVRRSTGSWSAERASRPRPSRPSPALDGPAGAPRRLPALFLWRPACTSPWSTIYVLICFFLILVVLLQQGKGADIAGAFGGGGSQTAFGARGATTFLHKLTTGAFVAFILLSAAALDPGGAAPLVRDHRRSRRRRRPQKAPAPAPGGAPRLRRAPAPAAPAAQPRRRRRSGPLPARSTPKP